MKSDLVTMLRKDFSLDMKHEYPQTCLIEYEYERQKAADRIEKLEAENIRLNERFGKYGLEPILINGVGHYVSAKVKDRIENLEAALRKYAEEEYNGFNGSGEHARKALEGKNGQ